MKVAGAVIVSAAIPALALAQSGQFQAKFEKSRKSGVAVSGTVSAISGSSITLTAKNGIAYTVDASSAKLYRRFGAAMQISDMQNGDTLQIKGTVSGTSVAATEIRDQSLQAKNGVFTGKVTAVSGSSFTLQAGRGSQTVNTDSSTVFKKNGQADSNGIVDVTAGASVVVSGVWDRTNSNVTAKSVNVVIRQLAIRVSGSVSSVSGQSLSMTDKTGTVYSVDASKARVTYKGGRKADAGIIQSGDSVAVTGRHQSGSLNITASLIRDLSRTTASSTVSSN